MRRRRRKARRRRAPRRRRPRSRRNDGRAPASLIACRIRSTCARIVLGLFAPQARRAPARPARRADHDAWQYAAMESRSVRVRALDPADRGRSRASPAGCLLRSRRRPRTPAGDQVAAAMDWTRAKDTGREVHRVTNRNEKLLLDDIHHQVTENNLARIRRQPRQVASTNAAKNGPAYAAARWRRPEPAKALLPDRLPDLAGRGRF